MNTRLQQFLSAEGLTQAQFADTLGVARASISHILAGRNNPGYDFFVNVIRYYPELNMEWLLLGKGKMYKDQTAAPGPSVSYEEPTLFNEIQENSPAAPRIETNSEVSSELNTSNNSSQTAANQRKISKIIVFYDDNSFQEFH